MSKSYLRKSKDYCDKLEVDESKITMDASFRQDLGADSLDTHEPFGIEEELSIQIPTRRRMNLKL